MRIFYSVQDIEDFIAQGISQLVIDENTTITGPARDLLRLSGIPVVEETRGGTGTQGTPAVSAVQSTYNETPVSRTGNVPMLQLALDYISVPPAVAMAVQV